LKQQKRGREKGIWVDWPSLKLTISLIFLINFNVIGQVWTLIFGAKNFKIFQAAPGPQKLFRSLHCLVH